MFMALALSSYASPVLQYSGRVETAAGAFTGNGQFQFAIVDEQSNLLWATGAAPVPGSAGLLPGAVAIPVNAGAFSVKLGDPSQGQPAMSSEALAKSSGLTLRIWFNDGKAGWNRLGQDIPLPSGTAAASSATITGAQADAILGELREIKQLLARQGGGTAAPQRPSAPPAPEIVTIPLGEGPIIGSTDAPIALVEFTDYQCPFCKRFGNEIMPELLTKFVSNGKLKLVARQLPLDFHKQAVPAARAVLCAHKLGKYEPFRKELFNKQESLSDETILAAAEAAGMKAEAFKACLADTAALEPTLLADGAAAKAAGITGTPSFVVGKVTDGKVTGLKIVGVSTAAMFVGEIEKQLATLAPAPAAEQKPKPKS